MTVVFIENYYKIYQAPLFSISTAACLLLIIFLILFPFFAAVYTHGIEIFLKKIFGKVNSHILNNPPSLLITSLYYMFWKEMSHTSIALLLS
jgi:hypothetical protein